MNAMMPSEIAFELEEERRKDRFNAIIMIVAVFVVLAIIIVGVITLITLR